MDQDLRLTKVQISSLEKLAKSGDNEAAAKLARYFDFYVHDYDSAKFWFETAARNGHVQSQYNLGVRLMTKRKDAGSCREAQSWFNMALANGSSKAQKALDELGPCPTLNVPGSEG
jgi:TPR repeat protein